MNLPDLSRQGFAAIDGVAAPASRLSADKASISFFMRKLPRAAMRTPGALSGRLC